uniref:7 cysteine domain n=1 Tax=Argas monolakensis TaxID=34602 RepID=Q09JF1_ARGMO|nr:7 cysteine domain [Argas monolakensis]
MQMWHLLLLFPLVYSQRFVGQYKNERNSNNQSVIYNCAGLKNLTKEERQNISLFPTDCRYYCDRRPDAQVIMYGYYEVGTPCTNSTDVFDENKRIKMGTCITSLITGSTIMKCDLNQPPYIKAVPGC